jgi:serine phosphatase RsbU (regulator of sigma subunit)
VTRFPDLGIPRARNRVLCVAGVLLGVFALRALVSDPVIGISFLYLLPTLLAAYWFGRLGGVIVGVTGAALFVLGAAASPQDALLTSGLLRLGIFCSAGFAFAALLGRQRDLRRQLARQTDELTELRALRSALVPPDIPERPAVDLATCFVPAQEQVAGDFFVVAEGPRDTTVVVVGDVVGKGLEAARRAAFVRTALVAYAAYHDNPCRLLELANAALVERAGASAEFVTAVCLVYRPEDHSISWALAGHPPPMLLNGARRLNGIAPSLPLGLDEHMECQRADLRLPAGEGVLLFTDGLTEARRPFADVVAAGSPRHRPRPELFGSERIAAVLSEHPDRDPEEVIRALRLAAERFTGGSALADDLCIVAVRTKD